MIDTEKMLNEIIERNKEFNYECEMNENGFCKVSCKVSETCSYENRKGFKIVSRECNSWYDKPIFNIEYYKPCKPMAHTKRRPVNPSDFMVISYKNGNGAFVLNADGWSTLPKKTIDKLLKLN